MTLQWGRGFAATEGRKSSPAARDNAELQWGRGFAATEGSSRISSAEMLSVALQWGRGLAATEGRHNAIGNSRCGQASMGPWLRSHGRKNNVRPNATAILLQWGRGFAATEGPRSRSCSKRETMLQWGRGFAATEGGGHGVTSEGA